MNDYPTPPGGTCSARFDPLREAQESSPLGGSDSTVQDYFNRGHSSEYGGDYDRAVAHYTEAIRLSNQAKHLLTRGDR
jgi:hypothetical protein